MHYLGILGSSLLHFVRGHFGFHPKDPKYLHSTKYVLCSRNIPYGLSKYVLYGYLGRFRLATQPLPLNSYTCEAHLGFFTSSFHQLRCLGFRVSGYTRSSSTLVQRSMTARKDNKQDLCHLKRQAIRVPVLASEKA